MLYLGLPLGVGGRQIHAVPFGDECGEFRRDPVLPAALLDAGVGLAGAGGAFGLP